MFRRPSSDESDDNDACDQTALGDVDSLEREDFAESTSVAAHGSHEILPPSDSGIAESDAHASAVAHGDPLAHSFFEQSAATPDGDAADDSYVIHQLSRGSRRAMYASLGIFAVSLLGIGTYTAYQNWIMPAPVELGATVADIPAVPVPSAQNAAPPSSRWQALLTTRSATPGPDVVPPSEHGAETQLSAATQPPVEFAITGATAQQAAQRAPAQAASTQTASARDVSANGTAAPSAEVASPAATPRVAESPIARAPAKPAESAAKAAPAEPMQVASAADLPRPSGGLPASAASGPTYDELVAVGHALSKKNKRVEASEAFRRALVQSPQGSAALSGLGYVYLNADEKQNAREYAQRAVQADASNAEGWIVLGAALELLGDRVGARDAYRNCVERGQGPYLTECRRVAR